jgi:hypothetical protein
LVLLLHFDRLQAKPPQQHLERKARMGSTPGIGRRRMMKVGRVVT